MSNYNWKEYETNKSQNRFPPGVNGIDAWNKFSESPEGKFRTPKKSLLKQPRLFISHKKEDYKEAIQISRLANKLSWNYWLDVLNPSLNFVSKYSIPKYIAAIIEMGLINSTHVIVIMTDKTVKSQWVPYEYGRVKDDKVLANENASWNLLKSSNLPEYMHLGKIFHNQAEIENWLEYEREKW